MTFGCAELSVISKQHHGCTAVMVNGLPSGSLGQFIDRVVRDAETYAIARLCTDFHLIPVSMLLQK